MDDHLPIHNALIDCPSIVTRGGQPSQHEVNRSHKDSTQVHQIPTSSFDQSHSWKATMAEEARRHNSTQSVLKLQFWLNSFFASDSLLQQNLLRDHTSFASIEIWLHPFKRVLCFHHHSCRHFLASNLLPRPTLSINHSHTAHPTLRKRIDTKNHRIKNRINRVPEHPAGGELGPGRMSNRRCTKSRGQQLATGHDAICVLQLSGTTLDVCRRYALLGSSGSGLQSLQRHCKSTNGEDGQRYFLGSSGAL